MRKKIGIVKEIIYFNILPKYWEKCTSFHGYPCKIKYIRTLF